MPRVSVIIPAYNHAPYVRACVDSALAQTYTDREVIVVDDGSTDGTREILRDYGEAIHLILQPNRGTQAARNTAVRAASGEFIALLDSDDVWLPAKLEKQVAALERQPAAGLVYSLAYTIDATGRRLNGGNPTGVVLPEGADAFQELLRGDFMPALTVMIRRACLQEIGLFDETLIGSGDWDLWLRIAARYPVICVPEPLALYRLHGTNTTHHLYRSQLVYAEHARVLEKGMQLAPHPLPPTIREQALARTHLWGAEMAAAAGRPADAGTELVHACQLDAHLLADKDNMIGRLVRCVHLCGGRQPRGADYRRIVAALFAPLLAALPQVAAWRRPVLATAAMSTFFDSFHAGDMATVRSLGPTGIAADPRWLRNRGVWSIMVRAILARRASPVPDAP
ncbi:MAG: glycosyltransferase family 2 protein [Anaerolineales bacterium]|nr:glycosyltransferase family 2 protein [Anaerolineales bacterium]MCB8950870.1 glycosyltransferase family 2 protein [Ardenticatenales bacterium]